MKTAASILTALAASLALPAHASGTLEGDQRLACEAIMCLIASSRPEQCEPSIRRYFSIRLSRPGATLTARTNFLKLCPRGASSDEVIDVIAAGAESCEAANLNTFLQVATGNVETGFTSITVSNVLPEVCTSYYKLQGLPTTEVPRYVGTPETGGYWVPASQYDAAYQAYLARLASGTPPSEGGGGGGGDGGGTGG